MTRIPSIPKTAAEEQFEKLFPRPPLFPPPPPSLNDDTNALLRKAIFNHMEFGRLKVSDTTIYNNMQSTS